MKLEREEDRRACDRAFRDNTILVDAARLEAFVRATVEDVYDFEAKVREAARDVFLAVLTVLCSLYVFVFLQLKAGSKTESSTMLQDLGIPGKRETPP